MLVAEAKILFYFILFYLNGNFKSLQFFVSMQKKEKEKRSGEEVETYFIS